MVIFEGLIGFIEHFGGDAAIEVGHGPFEIRIVHVDVEVAAEKGSGFFIDIEKLLGFSCEFIVHF